jgi:tRNA (guanine-N7-)-methyltransferase
MIARPAPTSNARVKEVEKNHPSLTRRSIRSFVVRGGRATAGQQRGLTELFPVYGIPADELTSSDAGTQRIDFDNVFGRSAPRMIEIGFGAGEALLEFSRQHPQMNCLGIEVHPPGIGHLLLGLDEAKITNVRVIARDAVEVLRDRIAPASIDLIHVFFPDPWPKKRHHKRRLIQPEFAHLLASVLAPNGVLRLATDWEHYAQHMREVLDGCAALRNMSLTNDFMPREASRVLTRFERRGQRLGHGVWDLAYEKTPT